MAKKNNKVAVSVGSIQDSGYLPSGNLPQGDLHNTLFQEQVTSVLGTAPRTITELVNDADFNQRNPNFFTFVKNEKDRQAQTGLKDVKFVQDEPIDAGLFSEFKQLVPLNFESDTGLGALFNTEGGGLSEPAISRGVRLTHHRFTSFMEPVRNPVWTSFKMSGPLDEKQMDGLLTALIYYPKVVDELISWMRSSEKEVSVITPLLEKRVRWGRDTYREGNFKFSTSELLSEIQKLYSSWKKDDGKQLLVCLIMELIRGDIQGSHWLKEDCDFVLPLRLPQKAWSLPQLDNLRATAIRKLLLKYFSLVAMLDEKSTSGSSTVFAEGKAMLETDLAMAIRTKKKAISALVYALERLEASWAITRALCLIKVYDLKPVNFDEYATVLESADLNRLVEDFSFVYPILNDVDVFEMAANLTLNSEEAIRHVTRVAEHWFDMPEYKTQSISEVKDRISIAKTYGPESKRVGTVLLTSVNYEGDSLFVASSHNASVLGSGFANYETHNFASTTQMYNELARNIASIGSSSSIQRFLQEARVEQYPLAGLFTNVGVYERFLVYLALNNGTLTLDHEVDVDNPSKLAISSIAGIIACPTPVFPLDLKLSTANIWFPNRVADEVYHLKDLTHWFLGADFNDQVWKKPWAEIHINLPQPTLVDETARTLDIIARTKAGFVLDISYTNAESKKTYSTRLQSDFVIGDEVLRDALLHIDQATYLINNYNLQLAIGLRDACSVSEATALKIDANDERLVYSIDQELISHFSKVFANSSIFRKLLARATHSLLVAMAGEEKFNAQAFQASFQRELENQVGLQIAEYLNLMLAVASPETFARFREAAERQLARRFFHLWR